jgi:hypothetical protein
MILAAGLMAVLTPLPSTRLPRAAKETLVRTAATTRPEEKQPSG